MRLDVPFRKMLFGASIIVMPSVVLAQETTELEQQPLIPAAMGKHLNTIAILNHCGSKGIAKDLEDKLIPAIMLHGRGSADVTSFEDTRRMYRESHINISGVVKGLRLAANVEPGDSLCSIATDAADEILSDPEAPWR